ncbi:WD40 repeat domain-containing protein [Kitasatospora sp. NPDC059599]|uniref:WD40 repeat domain-containing protein n=1 Tax=Kitasatospora sp. NPDC059599 TaxID=3346880 RepID=UPI00368133A7
MTADVPSDGPRREVAPTGARLTDPAWLVNADPEQVVAALDGAVGPEETAAAAVYRTSGHLHRESGAPVRRQLLALDAARHGDRELARSLAAVAVGHQDADDPWAVQWATGTDVDSRLRHALPAPAEVGVVATVVVADRGLAVVGCKDGSLHWWDPATGRKLGTVATGDTDAVRALATAVLGGRPVAVTGHAAGAVRVWDLAEGEPLATYRGAEDSWVNELATVPVEGRPVVVSAGTDGVLRVWDLAAPTGSDELLTIRTGFAGALATVVADGRPVAVTGHNDGVVRRWDLTTGRELGVGSDADAADAGVTSTDDDDDHGGRGCVTLELNARTHVLATDPAFESPLAVSANAYESWVWDLATGEQVGGPGPGFVEAAAVRVLRGRPTALVAGGGGPVQVWDLSTRTHLRLPLIGHAGTARAVATAVVKGRHLAVTGGDDRSVRVWDLDGERAGAGRPTGHAGPVHRVTTAVVDDRPVIVTGGADRLVRIWDLDGGQLGEPLAGHTGAVHLVTAGTVDGRPALLTRASSEAVRIWDLASREPLHGRTTSAYTSSSIDFFATVEGRFVAVTWEGRVWDLTAGAWIGVQPRKRGAMALEELDGRPVVLTGRGTDTAHLWDLATGEPLGPPLTGHTGRVQAGAVGTRDGRPVVAAGGDDGTVRVWEATTGEQTGGYTFPAGIRGLAVTPDGRLVVAFGADLAVLAHR